jgi:hypothetical protein
MFMIFIQNQRILTKTPSNKSTSIVQFFGTICSLEKDPLDKALLISNYIYLPT